MEIKIKLFGLFQDYLPQGERLTCTLDVPEGSKVRDVFTQLKIPSEALKVVLVNGLTGEDSDILRDGDVLSLFSPLAGG